MIVDGYNVDHETGNFATPRLQVFFNLSGFRKQCIYKMSGSEGQPKSLRPQFQKLDSSLITRVSQIIESQMLQTGNKY